MLDLMQGCNEQVLPYFYCNVFIRERVMKAFEKAIDVALSCCKRILLNF